MNGHTNCPTYAYVKHPQLKEVYPVVSCITQEIFDSAINYKAGPGDRFVVSFPKNGTTWALNILYLLENNGVPIPKSKNMDEFIPFLEFCGAEAVEKLPKPRTIKTHLYRSLIPFDDEAKYVFVGKSRFVYLL